MTRSIEQRDALHHIAQDARRLMQRFSPASAPLLAFGSQQKLPSHHHLIIPSPQSLSSVFIARGLSSPVAERLNQIYLDKALSLKQPFEDKYQEALQASLDSGAFRVYDIDQVVSATKFAYTSRYNQSLKEWQLKIDELSWTYLSAVSESSREGSGTGTGHRLPTFKPESVPILEAAFRANAYPGRADKESIAEETGMEYKQINIWFQNRRARSKKEGVPLQRIATFASQPYIPRYLTKSPSLDPRIADSFQEEHPPTLSDFFSIIVRPLHAFPTPYPALYEVNPFPTRSGGGSFEVPWPRSCVKESVHRSPVDIEQLIVKMESLTLSDGTSDVYKVALPSFALVAPRAPLPALLRTVGTLSRAQPVTTFVAAVRLSSGSRSEASIASSKLYRALPTRVLPTRPLSSHLMGVPTSIFQSHSRSATSRRSQTRSSSPSYSSRSSSLSSNNSSRSTSSSRSVASSTGPHTPISTSPRVKSYVLKKDASPSPPSLNVHRSSTILDYEHISSSPYR